MLSKYCLPGIISPMRRPFPAHVETEAMEVLEYSLFLPLLLALCLQPRWRSTLGPGRTNLQVAPRIRGTMCICPCEMLFELVLRAK